MVKQHTTNLLTLIIVAVVLVGLLDKSLAVTEKRLCADKNCNGIISMGKGLINYPAGEKGMVSFQINAKIRIKSKSVDKDPSSLWGIEVNGRNGYAPKKFIREEKIIVKEKDLHTVDAESVNPVPILTTSEKIVDIENTIDKTTTKPLNLQAVESTESVLKNSSNEKLNAASSPIATPVMPVIVDGTEIPNLSNELNDGDRIVKNLELKTDTNHNENVSLRSENAIEQNPSNSHSNNILATSEHSNKVIDDEPGKIQIDNLQPEVNSALSESSTVYEEENSFKMNDKEKYESNEQDEKENPNVDILQKPVISMEKTEISNNKNSDNSQIMSDTVSANDDEVKTDMENPQTINEIAKQPNDFSSENLKEVPTPIEKNDDIYSEKDIINKNMDNSHGVEEISYNSTQSDLKNDTTLNTKASQSPIDLSSHSIEINEAENFMDADKIQIETKTDQPMEIEDTEEIQSLHSNNDSLSKEVFNTESTVNSNVNVQVEPSSYLLLNNDSSLNATLAIPEQVAGEEQIVNDNVYKTTNNVPNENPLPGSEFNSKEISAENIVVVSENEAINNDVQATDNIDMKEAKVLDQTIYSKIPENINTDHSNDPIKDTIDSISILKSDEKIQNQEETLSTTPKILTQEEIAESNIIPTTHNPHSDKDVVNTPASNEYDNIYGEAPTTNINPNGEYTLTPPTEPSETVSQSLPSNYDQSQAVPSSTPLIDNYEPKENNGLFATIMGTVNNVLSLSKKKKQNQYDDGNHGFDKTLFSKNENEYNVDHLTKENSLGYCKEIGVNGDCPNMETNHEYLTAHFHQQSTKLPSDSDLTLEVFFEALASKILELSDLLAFLAIAAATSLLFIFGYYCFCNSSREGALLSKLNLLESSLLATHKENEILKHNLISSRQKLATITNNSFGSNDMVVLLRKELEEETMEKSKLQEQIIVLQKELENAADAGIELNKIVSELLSNQTGDESIISSVEELQKQLNEQQNTIFEINASLAEKSRENNELQLLIAEQNSRYETELANVQRDNDELELEKGKLQATLDQIRNDFDKDMTAALEGKNFEIKRLQKEIVDLNNKLENQHTKWQTSVAKVEALEECLKNIRRDPGVNIAEVIDVANVKAQLIEAQKMYQSLKERFETELDARKLAENQLEMISVEVEKLKQEFNQSEKDKLEAQTRLEVLSNYFKDKENQLQKELSLKEAMWLQQQGETTTTVDRVTAMQEEIQSLKSQNDALRAEIEAQVAAHKAQTGTLENRAHETWLAARQSDRRYEEARAEATALRRKLTALAGGNLSDANKPTTGPAGFGDELTQAPSPIHMESPGSPMLGRMPPPPFLPPPFIGPPPPFLGMPPPPPFGPPGEMRPAPLGRIMSPPPQRSSRFSPQHLDYDDYLDYESNNTWHRHTYSPPPRTYRSLSPTDSRYNYGTERDLMSTYDTETDFSPPPSPRESRKRHDNSTERIDNSTKISYGNTKKFNNPNKGPLSSGSEKSFNTPSRNDIKARKGNANHGGKALV